MSNIWFTLIISRLKTIKKLVNKNNLCDEETETELEEIYKNVCNLFYRLKGFRKE